MGVVEHLPDRLGEHEGRLRAAGVERLAGDSLDRRPRRAFPPDPRRTRIGEPRAVEEPVEAAVEADRAEHLWQDRGEAARPPCERGRSRTRRAVPGFPAAFQRRENRLRRHAVDRRLVPEAGGGREFARGQPPAERLRQVGPRRRQPFHDLSRRDDRPVPCAGKLAAQFVTERRAGEQDHVEQPDVDGVVSLAGRGERLEALVEPTACRRLVAGDRRPGSRDGRLAEGLLVDRERRSHPPREEFGEQPGEPEGVEVVGERDRLAAVVVAGRAGRLHDRGATAGVADDHRLGRRLEAGSGQAILERRRREKERPVTVVGRPLQAVPSRDSPG